MLSLWQLHSTFLVTSVSVLNICEFHIGTEWFDFCCPGKSSSAVTISWVGHMSGFNVWSNSIGLGSAGLDWSERFWVGLRWTWLGWAQLGWAQLELVGLNYIMNMVFLAECAV